jgi:hypothetical protein
MVKHKCYIISYAGRKDTQKPGLNVIHDLKMHICCDQWLVLAYSTFLLSALLINCEQFHFDDWLHYSVTE